MIGSLVDRNQVRSSFGDWLNGILELSVSLEEMDLDVSAFACLAALSLLHGMKSILLEKCWRILMNLTDGVIAKLYVT